MTPGGAYDPWAEGRVPRLSPGEARRRAHDVGVPVEMADLSIFQVLLHHPRLAKQLNDLLWFLIFETALGARVRELVIMRIGWVTGSDYEWTQHWRVAALFKVPADDLAAVRDWRSSDRFSPAERAALAATDEVLSTGAMGEATWRECEAELGTEQALELLACIGAWRMISAMLRSLAVPLEEGVPSWPPDGRGPSERETQGPSGPLERETQGPG